MRTRAAGKDGPNDAELPLRAGRSGAVLAVVFVLTACVDPAMPLFGVPTLDDSGADGFVAVSVGQSHSCALKADGAAYCWGSNEFGQLGIANAATTCLRGDRHVPCVATPRAVLGGLKYTRIAAGANHTCAIALDSRVYCWGDNLGGQIGDPAVRQATTPTPILANALFVDVASGDEHTCALRTDDVVMCWGANDYRQLGVTGGGSAIPVAAQTSLRFASVSAGARRTCARVPDGTAYCWGAHWVSRANDGTEILRPQALPARVLGAPSLQDVSVGGQTTCGLATDGLAHCWEANPTGAMGDATTSGSVTPRAVATGERFIALSVGASHTCGVSDLGAAWCWGSDASGQLGVPAFGLSRRCGPSAAPCILSPMKVSGWRRYSVIGAGLGDHVCGITIATNVYCWGAGAIGQLGAGSVAGGYSPTKVSAP